MQSTKLFIVTKLAQEHCPLIQSTLDHQYITECYESCQCIPEKQTQRPLLQPAQVILFFTEGWQPEEVIAELEILTPKPDITRTYALLFVTTENFLPKISQHFSEEDDFIFVDYSTQLLHQKIQQLSQRSNLLKKLKRDLHEASEIALLSMSNSSELGEVSRFILASYNCKNYDELLDALFQAVEIFGVSCSALIVVDDKVVVRIAKHSAPKIRHVMLKHHNQGRIHHLGTDVIISFTHATMMVHDMPVQNEMHFGRLLDNLTVLGNCFEARAKGIHTEEEADAASRAKTMFLATMSHELRTPMNSVIGFTERLIEKLDGRITEREQKHLHTIKRNGDHLLSVINDILDMSKIETGKMEIHPEIHDAVTLINDIFLQLQPIAKSNTLEFKLNITQSTAPVCIDQTRFTQMVMNLVSNAIKYTAEGFVHIEVYTQQHETLGECLCIAVQDSGIGISEEDQKSLFGNFVQIDSELCRKVEGTGLGLAISMVFAEMHGGHIDVESEQGIGSCFSINLPLPNNPRSPAPNPIEPTDDKALKLLAQQQKPPTGDTGVELF
ncbi:sensor histidine kinase [Marinagarivorans cellulosilyticus]|uniref:histidine kinase n=1 Tax=Marinagarivorans cellulosilyticus TaxID=2721545 RepID=A0AAN2BKA8_9GAMM|nr:ATP-binding protein [Marinagarivorans cellulosilyticus]BCD97878.1 hypothetical protein MARGE09_P2079 [Marinagarivorans cellulosilyticus]